MSISIVHINSFRLSPVFLTRKSPYIFGRYMVLNRSSLSVFHFVCRRRCRCRNLVYLVRKSHSRSNNMGIDIQSHPSELYTMALWEENEKVVFFIVNANAPPVVIKTNRALLTCPVFPPFYWNDCDVLFLLLQYCCCWVLLLLLRC